MRIRFCAFYDLLLAGFVAFGAMVIGLLCFALVLEPAIHARQAGPHNGNPRILLESRADGEPVLNSGGTLRDLAGNPIEFESDDDKVRFLELPAQRRLSFGSTMRWFKRIELFPIATETQEYWYLMHNGLPAGNAYFEGFSGQTRSRLGFIGTAGFDEREIPPAERFAIPGCDDWQQSLVAATTRSLGTMATVGVPPNSFGAGHVYLACESTLYEVNLRRRRVTKLLPLTSSPIRSIGFNVESRKTRVHYWLGVRTDDAVYLLEPDGTQTVLPLVPELRERYLELVRRGPTGFTVAALLDVRLSPFPYHVRIYSVTNDGQTTALGDVHLSAFGRGHVGLELDPLPYFYLPVASGSPVAILTSALSSRAPYFERAEVAPTWQAGAAMALSEAKVYFYATVAVGLALAVFCYRRERRFAASRPARLFWPLFVFLFGWPGWIGYRYRRNWPVLEPCPACHQPAPRNSPACARCGEEFPTPAQLGTEIFA